MANDFDELKKHILELQEQRKKLEERLEGGTAEYNTVIKEIGDIKVAITELRGKLIEASKKEPENKPQESKKEVDKILKEIQDEEESAYYGFFQR
jgi:cell division septum initiation protein DivIVA